MLAPRPGRSPLPGPPHRQAGPPAPGAAGLPSSRAVTSSTREQAAAARPPQWHRLRAPAVQLGELLQPPGTALSWARASPAPSRPTSLSGQPVQVLPARRVGSCVR